MTTEPSKTKHPVLLLLHWKIVHRISPLISLSKTFRIFLPTIVSVVLAVFDLCLEGSPPAVRSVGMGLCRSVANCNVGGNAPCEKCAQNLISRVSGAAGLARAPMRFFVNAQLGEIISMGVHNNETFG